MNPARLEYQLKRNSELRGVVRAFLDSTLKRGVRSYTCGRPPLWSYIQHTYKLGPYGCRGAIVALIGEEPLVRREVPQ